MHNRPTYGRIHIEITHKEVIIVANIKSQKKRIEVSRKENEKNTAIRSRVKNAVKKFNAAVEAGDLALAEKLFPETVSIIDEAQAEGVLHANTAARKVATISRTLDRLKASK